MTPSETHLAAGRSDGAEKYIMVLSDGQSQSPEIITSAMKRIAGMKINTFAVAVGDVAKSTESRSPLRHVHYRLKLHEKGRIHVKLSRA